MGGRSAAWEIPPERWVWEAASRRDAGRDLEEVTAMLPHGAMPRPAATRLVEHGGLPPSGRSVPPQAEGHQPGRGRSPPQAPAG
jgi:hypothetical protein